LYLPIAQRLFEAGSLESELAAFALAISADGQGPAGIPGHRFVENWLTKLYSCFLSLASESMDTVLSAGVDDSGTSPENAVTVAAGWVAHTHSWSDFQVDWDKACNIDGDKFDAFLQAADMFAWLIYKWLLNECEGKKLNPIATESFKHFYLHRNKTFFGRRLQQEGRPG
jgi:hypothetical protein